MTGEAIGRGALRYEVSTLYLSLSRIGQSPLSTEARGVRPRCVVHHVIRNKLEDKLSLLHNF